MSKASDRDLIDLISENNAVQRQAENMGYRSQAFVKEATEDEQLERS